MFVRLRYPCSDLKSTGLSLEPASLCARSLPQKTSHNSSISDIQESPLQRRLHPYSLTPSSLWSSIQRPQHTSLDFCNPGASFRDFETLAFCGCCQVLLPASVAWSHFITAYSSLCVSAWLKFGKYFPRWPYLIWVSLSQQILARCSLFYWKSYNYTCILITCLVSWTLALKVAFLQWVILGELHQVWSPLTLSEASMRSKNVFTLFFL